MNFETFINEWLPKNCPIEDYEKIATVELYVDKCRKLKSLAWVIRVSKEEFKFLIHEEDLPDVKNIRDDILHKPIIFVHES